MGNVRGVRFLGGLLLLVGLVSVLPGVAAAAATPRVASHPVVSVTPTRIAAGGGAVSVSGSGLPSGGSGEISECSTAAPQPTVAVRGVATPVSCSRPRRVHFNADGALAAVGVRAVDGTVGPPGPGADSSGSAAAADAGRYPCPPTPSQAATGARCYLRLSWGSGVRHQRLKALTFVHARAASGARGNDQSSAPSAAHAHDPSAASTDPSRSAAAMTVRPHTNLTNGRTVVVRATGLPHYGTGWIMECSSVTPQTSIAVAGARVPVSCTDPMDQRWTFGATGRLRATFQIATGIIGPPRSGTTATGRSADAVARRYPCPPTAAQTSAGFDCVLELEWSGGHRLVQALEFASSVTPTTTPTTVKPVTTVTTSGSGSAPSVPKAGSLPVTGASIEQMAVTGTILVILGSGLLLVGESPRRTRRRRGYAATPLDP